MTTMRPVKKIENLSELEPMMWYCHAFAVVHASKDLGHRLPTSNTHEPELCCDDESEAMVMECYRFLNSYHDQPRAVEWVNRELKFFAH